MSDDPEFDRMVEELRKPAPHERSGFLRAHRAGWTSEQIAETFGMTNTDVLHELAQAVQEEAIAYTAGLPFHHSTLKDQG